MSISSFVSMLRYVAGQNERDFVERMHSVVTVNILIAFAVLISFKQFGGSPIECLTPDVFTEPWEEYTEMFCFAQDTYHVPIDEIVDAMPRMDREERQISYYQWVPFFLILQAACFRIPSMIWKYVSDQSGLKVNEILNMALDDNNVKPEIKANNIKALSTHLQGALHFHRRLLKRHIQPHRVFCLFNLPYSTCYVTLMFLLTRFLDLANVFIQLYAMNMFLETNRYQFYGIDAVMDVLNGRNWDKSGLFPRSTLCDFKVRVMGNIQEHTVQCVLLINLLNEKVFVFLWFWYLFLFLFTFASFMFWLWTFVMPCVNRQFIFKHLEMSELPSDTYEHSRLVHRFVRDYLRLDGVFVIRTLVFQAGVIFGTELLVDVYKSYLGIEEKIRSNFDPPPPSFMSLAMEDQSEYENRANYVRQRRKPRPNDDYYAETPLALDFNRAKLEPGLHYTDNRIYPPPMPVSRNSGPPSVQPSTQPADGATSPPANVLKAFAENQKLLDDFQQYLANNRGPRQDDEKTLTRSNVPDSQSQA
ncbi:unnamed protein product [Bursaphelenchus xylophilus]|uniref:Innexin n=1 Tax=Bursaphelenchus xylophilus TaxID=6326 RepID=A0A1I7S579_BURXY|nr:unnamed protein product [Bursaphelenchus xylophilus]CAG9117792.1 unnamed protein product [Bursaphelenchus xylophilus]